MRMLTDRELVAAALRAAAGAYAPYSGCTVGAALLADDGRVFTGCNVENAAFSPTCCAERTAFFKAVSEGARRFCKIAVAGAKNGVFADYFVPCGVCRQVMAEFCGADFEILIARSEDDFIRRRLDGLLPERFSAEKLG